MSILVRRLKEFIKSLKPVKDKLSQFDLECFTSLEEKFDDLLKAEEQSKTLDEIVNKIVLDERELNEVDLAWLEQLFLTRWQKLSTVLQDYNYYKGCENWILLAKDLAPYSKKLHLFIFQPIIAKFKIFIESFSAIKNELNINDLNLLNNIKIQLNGILACNEDNEDLLHLRLLKADYLAWIEKLFAERWKKVQDTVDDYTFYTGGVNAHLISFAKDLAPHLHKPHLLILIPILANNDPNNFERLKRVPDARSIFLSNENSWYRLLSLHASGVFGIGGKLKNARIKPLTLKEFMRIRCKRGDDLAFKANNGIIYASFWDYIKREIAPTWKNNGACSTYILPYLLEIIETYFEVSESNDLESFRLAFKHFSNYLATCFISEINNFYGAPISVAGENYFLFEILLDCMQENTTGLDLKLINVARWISIIDPSLVSQKEILQPVYKGMQVGSNFDLLFLKELIIDLNVQDTNVLKGLYDQFLDELDLVLQEGYGYEIKFQIQIINKLKTLYALRWEKVIDTKLDYLRHFNNPANFPWIRLAQYLAGAKFIEANYFKLLIPSLRSDYDPITKELLTVYPLSKYILSSNGEELIFLPNCIAHYKENGTFFNCNYREPMPLKSKELERLDYADPEILSYFHRIEEKIDDLPISKKTWDEIYKLVNETLVVEGLSNPQIKVEDYDIATKSYDRFVVYVNELSTDEKNGLFRHRILLRSRKVTVQEILDLIQTPNYDWRVCIVGQAEFFLKLLIDYAPETKFNDSIEQRVNVAGMRAHSAKKVYGSYNNLTEEEAIRRILIIMTSLLTHSFQCIMLTGNWISFGNHENKVTETGKEIFSLIKKYLEEGDFKFLARFLYAQIVEHIVETALANNNWLRYQDTYEWLNKIKNGSLFENSNQIFFEPDLLITFLWSIAKTKLKINDMIEEFLDHLHEIIMSSDNNYKKWISVNVKFLKFLNNEKLLNSKDSIIQTLRMVKDIPRPAKYVYQASKEFFIHRLAQLGSLNYNYKASGLFGHFPGDYLKVYAYFQTEISKKLALSFSNQNEEVYSLPNLISKLQSILMSTKGKDLESIENYLKQFIQKMPATETTNEQKLNSIISCLKVS